MNKNFSFTYKGKVKDLKKAIIKEILQCEPKKELPLDNSPASNIFKTNNEIFEQCDLFNNII